MRQECSICRGGGASLNSGGIHVGKVRGGSHGATSWDTAEGAAPGVRAAKSSKFG